VTIPLPSRTQVLIDWISSLGWDTAPETGYPLYPGPYRTDANTPDRAVVITGTGGPGFVTEEGLPNAATFQARVRGTSDDPSEPEQKAEALDLLILGASFPASIDGVTINHAHRLGGPPTPLPVNPADERHEFTCNYVAIIGV
jgi:hypothetical protein